ncbi:MAG: methionine--tRNA ligase subunit beta [Acidobacteria bacterium]|nr:methionine--tRNA ligase subunit beta [Acidobacteriota bacterium]MBI3658468.1 methionine--tRNA ligase subunit beta [Acidobacteriota bacterium]
MENSLKPQESAAATTEPAPASLPAQPTVAKPVRISIEDFAKIELRVGEVLEAEKVSGSKKLIRLLVDIGDAKRQIVAGIGDAYQPEALLHRKVVIVANLEPRKLMGLESDGMIVAASNGPDPVLVAFTEPVAVGARLR